MSQIADILKRAMEAATGRKLKRVWYEPIHGPAMEMCGHAGGWMYEDENGEDVLGGYTAEEAIECIMNTAKIRAYAEYDHAHRESKKKRGAA